MTTTRLLLTACLVLFAPSLAAQARTSRCPERACGLWTDGFNVMVGSDGRRVGDDSLRALASGDPAAARAERVYTATRSAEELKNAMLWTSSIFVPGGFYFLWLGRTARSLAEGAGPEDPSSEFRRAFLTEMVRTYPGEAASSPADTVRPTYLLAKTVVVDARTGVAVAPMRPLWNSFRPIRELVRHDAEALQLMDHAATAQMAHRVSTVVAPVSFVAMIAALTMAFGGVEDGISIPVFWGGAIGTIGGIALRIGSERAAREDVGRALYMAAKSSR